MARSLISQDGWWSITTRIPPDLEEAVRLHCERYDLSSAQIVRRALRVYFDDTSRITSEGPRIVSKPRNPSDTHDAPSVGTVEHMSPQSEQVEEGKGGGG